MSQERKPGAVGAPCPIDDAAKKATGQLRYVDDMKLPGMLYARVLFSTSPHARIAELDVSDAEAIEGVRAVVSYRNTPAVYYNSSGETLDIFKTERVFDDTVRFIGDRVAAVAADTPEIAARAIRAIRVKYEPLPVNLDPEAGMADDAYVIHTHGSLEKGNLMETVTQSCGDVDEAIRRAPHVFSDVYTVPPIHHGALEPHTAIADYDASGKLTLYTASQDSFAVRTNLSRIFSLPMSRVRVSVPAVGGAFGSKVDMILEPVAAALSMRCGRPVKLTYSRREDIVSTRTRHAMKIYLTTAVDDDGTILAEDMKVYCNAGAYASGTSNIVWAMCGKFFKVHRCKNVRFTGYPVITNTPVGGPMRGFGSPQTFYAQQRQMNRIAAALSMDMMTLQLRNLTFPDGVDYRFDLPHGSAQPRACLQRAAELIGYEEAIAEQARTKGDRIRIGVGVGVGAHGNGMFGIRTDITALVLKMNGDGTCTLFTGAHEMGNSSLTMQKQMIADTLGMSLSDIAVVAADTELTPYQLGDYSSRGAFVTGRAALLVAEDMKQKLTDCAKAHLSLPDGAFTFQDACVTAADGRRASLHELVQFSRHRRFTELISECTGAANAAVISYGAHIVKLAVDTQTGRVRLLRYAAVHDLGLAINPLSVRGQIEGAVQMGAGYALCEGLQLDETGRVRNATFKNNRMLRADEMPETLLVDWLNIPEPAGPHGAKSIGECAVVPAAAAVSNAVSNAIDRPCDHLPLTPERILELLKT